MNRNSCQSDNIKEIVSLLTKLRENEGYAFLTEILTPTELQTISKRWEIIKMLNQGSSQRDISKELSVSLCKVTRGAKILKNKNSVVKNFIQKEL